MKLGVFVDRSVNKLASIDRPVNWQYAYIQQNLTGVLMSTAQKLDTRDRLVHTAADLIWERSFQATGVDELCQRADARKGSFYYYFKSKTELAVAAIESFWETARARFFDGVFAQEGSGLAQLDAFLDAMIGFQQEVAEAKGGVLGCPFGNLGQEMARQDEHIRTTLDRIFAEQRAYLAHALDRAVEQGEVPEGDNARRAESILALMQGAMLMTKVSNDLGAFQRARAAVLAIARGA